MTRNEYGDLSALFLAKFQALETKVDALNQDRVTRSDFENLRKDISNSYVPRDTYEARHAILIEQDSHLELQIREMRKDYEAEMKALRDGNEKDAQRIHERLESGKQQMEERIRQQAEMQLSTRDRNWLRISQALGFISIALYILDWITQHIKLQ